MKKLSFLFAIVISIYISLVETTKTPSSKPLKIDLNLPPPDEHEDTSLHHSPIRSDPNVVNHDVHNRIGSHPFNSKDNLSSPVSNKVQDDCEFHHPGCVVWNTLSKKEKNKERQRFLRKNRTEEQKSSARIASRIRKKKFYERLGKDGRQAYLLKNAESRKNRLDKMSAIQKKEWYKKNNSYSRKSSKPSSPR